MSTIQLKRSSVASKVPLTSDLALGELAMNTNDGLLFFKKDPGTPSIVTLVTTDATQTLTNKTFTDSLTTFQDDADNTKKFQFQASDITTNTTRTITIPNATGTMSLIGLGETITGTKVFRNSAGIKVEQASTQDAMIVSGRAGGTSSYTLTLTPTTLTSSKTATFQDLDGTVALTANKLSAFASTTSSELAGVISDETGSGSLVFGTSPTISGATLTGDTSISGNATFSGALVNITGANTTIGDAATDVLNVNAISVFNANTTLKGSEILIDNASGTGGAAEGGELHFAIPTANTTLSGPIAIDIYQNSIRFFETTGTNRGAYIDLSAATAGAGSNLLAGGGATNLTLSSNSSTVTILSDTGTDATILAANATTAGVLTADAQTIGGSKTFSANTTLSYGYFGTTSGQANASAGVFTSNAYAYLGGAGGNYLAFGQQTDFSQWIQSGYSAVTPTYYPIILNPLGGNIGIGNTTPVDKLSVDGTVNVTGNTAIAGVLAITKHTETVTTATVSSLTYNIDLSLSNVFNLTLSSNTTFTFTNPPAAGVLKPVTVILTQDATGGRTVSFNSVKYTDGTAPQFTTTANAIDVMTFFTVNGGSWYFGTFAMAAVA